MLRAGAVVLLAMAAPSMAPAPDPEAGEKVHQQIVAFDQCTDGAIFRGEEYAYELCAHTIYAARAISDASGLGYKPTENDIRAVIRRKIVERYGGRALPPKPKPSFDY